MTLETRIARLEAAEAIRNLKARYCELCDSGYPADPLAALFTQDAVWDGGEVLGVHHGREAIGRFFSTMPSTLSFAIHHVTNPRIEVAADADSATGHWLLLQAATDPTGQHAMWLAGTYEDEYVRSGDEWLFRRVTLSTRFLAPYERGWAAAKG
ncbi:nuclear transport factor 2 family protein [Blastococcus sp. SYSU D00695]